MKVFDQTTKRLVSVDELDKLSVSESIYACRSATGSWFILKPATGATFPIQSNPELLEACYLQDAIDAELSGDATGRDRIKRMVGMDYVLDAMALTGADLPVPLDEGEIDSNAFKAVFYDTARIGLKGAVFSYGRLGSLIESPEASGLAVNCAGWPYSSVAASVRRLRAKGYDCYLACMESSPYEPLFGRSSVLATPKSIMEAVKTIRRVKEKPLRNPIGRLKASGASNPRQARTSQMRTAAAKRKVRRDTANAIGDVK